MELTGKIIQKLDVQSGTSSRGPWQKQEFIIETEDKFPKKVCVSAWAEKVDEISRLNINDSVKVSINIESREYNGRWYTDVRAWKIEAATQGSAPNPQGGTEYNQAPVVENYNQEDMSDDLPF